MFLPNECFFGDVDMFPIMKALLEEHKRRNKKGRSNTKIPVRLDHGIKMLDDYGKSAHPGYIL